MYELCVGVRLCSCAFVFCVFGCCVLCIRVCVCAYAPLSVLRLSGAVCAHVVARDLTLTVRWGTTINPLALIMELMPFGDLHDLLEAQLKASTLEEIGSLHLPIGSVVVIEGDGDQPGTYKVTLYVCVCVCVCVCLHMVRTCAPSVGARASVHLRAQSRRGAKTPLSPNGLRT